MFVAAFFMVYELSTPFVNARWMLDKMGLRNSLVYKVNGLTMVAVFFAARIFPAQLYLFKVVYTHRHELDSVPQLLLRFVVFAWFCSLALNLYWFRKMLAGALKVFSAKSLTTDKKTQ